MTVFKIVDKSIHHFGDINDGKININFQNRNISIKLEDIIKILFLKRRKLHWNSFFLFIALVFFMLVYFVNLVFLFQLIFLGSGLITLIVSFFLKSYEHKFVLIKKYDFIVFVIQKDLISEVENLVQQFNKTPRKLISVTGCKSSA